MIKNAFGLIYTGENNPNMRDLALSRAVAAMPFGGRYRCVDFILSNLVHTGVSSVGLIAQKNYHSLMDHLGAGKEWDLHRKREGLFILPPYMTKESSGLYRGSIDAYRASLGYVRRCPQQYVILSGSHTIFNTSFHDMYEQHIRSGADITIMYNEVTEKDMEADGGEQYKDLRLEIDENGRVTSMELDPYRPRTNFRSCDVLIMDKLLLEYLVEEAYARGQESFTRDVLLKKCQTLRIYGWKYDGYVARMNSVSSFFHHNLAVLDPEIRADLFDRKRPVYTKVKDEVSARYGENAAVKNAIVADGCEVDGTVENSVLFRGVKIGKGSVVKNSIIMQGVTIGEGVTLDHVVLDKGTTIRNGRTLVGYDGCPIILKKNTNV